MNRILLFLLMVDLFSCKMRERKHETIMPAKHIDFIVDPNGKIVRADTFGYKPKFSRIWKTQPRKPCKHIWVQQYLDTADYYTHIVCLKCRKKEGRIDKLIIDSLLYWNPLTHEVTQSVYSLGIDSTGNIVESDCEQDCYNDWCCVCGMNESDPRHTHHTQPLIPCH